MTLLCYTVSYPKAEWSRSEAWDHLHAQCIPGCPKVRLAERVLHTGDRWGHGWYKYHNQDHWAWTYYTDYPMGERAEEWDALPPTSVM
jgi:hypothetical protein